MSFTKFLRPDPLRTREWYMRLFIEVANELKLPEQAACVLAAMCCFQEAGVKDGDPPFERRIWCPANPTKEPSSLQYDHDSYSDDGRSVGICQQQRGPKGELWWGTVADEMNPRTAIRSFMSRLPRGFHANDAEAANGFVQGVQRSGVPYAYAQWWGDAVRLYKEVKAGVTPTVPTPLPENAWEDIRGPWTGDPIWLADVLRREGVTVVECDGWLNRGHGDMGALWGVVCHHTGSSNSTWQSIAYGRSDLKGPLSQIHLRRDGTAELVAVGVAWHAGTGGAPGLGKHVGNQRCIGIEAQNNGTEGWTPAQYNAYVRICAAFCRRIGVDASHVISHQEYDDYDPATDEGKWDPGGLDMKRFRADVQRQIDTKTNPPKEDDDMALNEIVGSWSPFRAPGEKPHMTVREFIQSIDGMTHFRHTILAAAIGDEKHRKLLETLAAMTPQQWAAAGEPGRTADSKLAKLAIDAIDTGKLAPELIEILRDPAPVVEGLPAPEEPKHAERLCAINGLNTCAVGGGTTCSLADDGLCVAKPKE